MSAHLVESLAINPVVAQIMATRGHTDVFYARRFLSKSLSDLRQPINLPGVASAAGLIRCAIENHKTICIYGDYDVDGVTGTAILIRTLRHLGADVFPYIPHRIEEGYSLNDEAIRHIAAQNTSLLITVDCGAGSPSQVALAKSLGMQVIVTDHHPAHTVSSPDILIHCQINPGSYGFTGLCGSATAWKLASFLLGSVNDQLAADNLALAALGTVADVVPLVDENRIIVHHGLLALQSTSNLGLQSLLSVAKATPPYQASILGFQLAPRLNACGRLAHADIALSLLLTESQAQAELLAWQCDDLNGQRKTIEKGILEEARHQISIHDPAIVLMNDTWHPGVVGIVASKLAEETGKPVILGHRNSTTGQISASGRSIPGLPLNKVLEDCQHRLLSFGGHAQAVGLRLRESSFISFHSEFMNSVCAHWPSPSNTPSPFAPIPAHPSLFTHSFIAALNQLQPFGAGNPEPVFRVQARLTARPRTIGSDQTHLSMTIDSFRSVAFGMAPRLPELVPGATYNWLIRPSINTWQGKNTVEFQVQDFTPA